MLNIQMKRKNMPIRIICFASVIACVSCQITDEDMRDISEDQFADFHTRESALEILNDNGSENNNGTLPPGIMDLTPVNPVQSPPRPPNHASWCTTDDVPEPTVAAASDAVPTPPYRAVLFADDSEIANAPPFPSNLRGGPIPDIPPDPAMGILLSDYRAQGCDRSERANDHACYSHPYRRALEEEYAHPERIFEQARAYYAPTPQ